MQLVLSLLAPKFVVGAPKFGVGAPKFRVGAHKFRVGYLIFENFENKYVNFSPP